MPKPKGRKMMQQAREARDAASVRRVPPVTTTPMAGEGRTDPAATGWPTSHQPEPVPAANRAPERPDIAPGHEPSAWDAAMPPAERTSERPGDSVAAGMVRYVLGVTAAAVTAMVTIGVGAPVLGHGSKPLVLAGGTVLAAAFADTARRTRNTRELRRGTVAVAAVAVLLVAAFAWGAHTSLVIDGKVYPVTSTEARVKAMTDEMFADRQAMNEADVLLGLDATATRARFRELGPKRKEMLAIAARWSTQQIDELPDGELAPPASALSQAANFAAEALQRKEDLLGVSDAKLEEELTAYRESFVQAALTVIPSLQQIAEKYGFELDTDAPAGE